MTVRRWAVALLAVAAAGCSASTSATVPEPGVEAWQLAMPFDAYNFSPAEVMTLTVAEDLLTRDCMRGKGHGWELLPRAVESDIEPPHRRRYGVIEPQIADKYGYHSAPDRPTVAARKAKQLARAKQTADLRGAVKDCGAQAEAVLSAGTPDVDAGRFDALIRKSFEDSQRLPEVTEVFRAWSACMSGEGFTYPDPLTAITDEKWSTPTPTPQEIRAAQADVRCKAKTNLVAVWAAAETRVQNDAIAANPNDFHGLRAGKTGRLEAAKQVIARG
ncbi:hypothetical protein DMH04_03350 [Kibdelosporangium aridum]|uniref:Lipoprotein n=1 Tax=Kibdelosporangium aridum TaxID=2030 RepID=A0A428ZR20_KIBAR|nr:hypothetical protein [Kibdelosporangium aridum]RSM90514.1 hypothetical protein DMH04_03350 [Kibdelosporangium aridum]